MIHIDMLAEVLTDPELDRPVLVARELVRRFDIREREARDTITGIDLNGTHIGKWIAFQWIWPTSNVISIVYGELREVHHTAREEIYVNLSGGESQGDKTEFTIYQGSPVWIEVEE